MELLNDFNTSVRKSFSEIDLNWESYDGLVVCGSWPGENNGDLFFESINKVKEAKENNIPVLGICFGMQVICVVSGFELKKLPERNIGLLFTSTWYGETYESYWNDYAVFDRDKIMYWFKIEKPFVMGVQFHPEYQSSKKKPHPVLKEFLEVCKSV